ncbi:hypothetical protein [Nocardia sp. NPDC057668]|uniref:hypothetical protein n=1 Tax=Nocardia sp. NPDC057668 TaxID=3346202 RepID=UPI00366B4CDA
MFTIARAAASGLAPLAVLAAPLFLSPDAAAEVSAIDIETLVSDMGRCGHANTACSISVTTVGADREAPVTLSINGVALGQRTPAVHDPKDGRTWASFNWVPDRAGVYEVTATQGPSTLTRTFDVCPTYRGSGSAASYTCDLVNTGSDSGSSPLAVALITGSASR